MSAIIPSVDVEEVLLPHESHNLNGCHTILLIHGAMSSSKEWKDVWPHLTENNDYHILIPDLPCHGKAISLEGQGDSFDLDDTADRLATLVREKARNGVAHVVGMSIGAHVGADLTARYPDRVSTLFVTGFNFFPRDPNSVFSSIFSVCSPVVVYLLEHGVSLATKPKEAMARIGRGEGSLSLVRNVLEILFQDRPLPTIRRRTLIIAATQERLLLPKDSTDSAKRLYQTVQEGTERKVVQHRGIVHAWSIEQPELFAKTVQWWIEEGMLSGSALPGEFEDIPI